MGTDIKAGHRPKRTILQFRRSKERGVAVPLMKSSRDARFTHSMKLPKRRREGKLSSFLASLNTN